MSSSTSSSRPLALLGVIALALGVEALVGATATRFMESQPLIYATKLDALDGALRGDVVFLGDSTVVAAARPDEIEALLPEGVRAANLGVPGSGPVVGEFLLRRYLDALPDAPPPRLVVLGYSTLSFTDWRTSFVEYPLTHLLPLGAVARAAWAQRDAGYLLEWTATRLPTLRHREELKSGALSLVFDRWPALAEPYRALRGEKLEDREFRWRYTRRAERNRELARALVAERGWHDFEEMRLRGGRLLPGIRYDEGPFYFPPFAAAPREERALERLLELCAGRGIPVLVLPPPQPRALAAAQGLAGGDARLDAFAERVFAGREDVRLPLGLRLPWPHRFFGDLTHVNPAGRERYLEAVAEPLRAALAAAPAPAAFGYPRPSMSADRDGSDGAGSRAEVEASLRLFFAERSDGTLSPEQVDPSRHLFDAGYLDSMSSLSLLDFVEERYGVTIPEVELVGGLGTLSALAEYVAQRTTPAA